MKTLIIILLLIPIGLRADSDKFVDTMTKNIDLVYQATTIHELQAAVNAFDRIASAEKTRWEPYYYSAFGNIMIAIREQEASRKDAYLDLALAGIAKANPLTSEASELAALEGFVHMMRITIDPANRGQVFTQKAYEAFEKAKAANPNNPRALALIAQMDFGTAQFFHASPKGACEANEKALPLFSSPLTDNPLAPRWGESMARELKSRCESVK